DRKEKLIYEFDLAVERIRAAREAIGNSGVLLVGRAEGFLVGRENIDQVMKRLVAYSEAGADCLYAPGFKQRDDIRAIVAAVAPKPSNILIGGAIGLSMEDAAGLGGGRGRVWGGVPRAAGGRFNGPPKEAGGKATFDELANASHYEELQKLFEQN